MMIAPMVNGQKNLFTIAFACSWNRHSKYPTIANRPVLKIADTAVALNTHGLKVIDYAIKVGCTYFTFNIPNTKCDDCGFITKHNVDECPKCHSTNLTKYTRIIGYLRPTKAFSKGRQIEEKQRTYTKIEDIHEIC